MSIIEKAAQRLEQLRKAGVELPAIAVAPRGADPIAVNPGGEHRLTGERHPPALQPVPPAAAPALTPADDFATTLDKSVEHGRRSRFVEMDLVALAAAGYVTPEAQRSQAADEFRVLKRPIIKNAKDDSGSAIARGNCVMVTSALPGEGKSFVALNLALSIASEVDSTVLLIDADVANPNILKRMHLAAARGLLDLLTNDSTELADVLLRTNVDKLSLLPAGTSHRRATEMLASMAMADLVKQMSARYPDRILVFDSPPLLATTEARVLASHMGQIVMVVEADRTTQGAVMAALETIENCPVVLMVLNKGSRTDVGGYYGYGSYGTYGSYGSRAESA